ncbi:choloylglycine hydrolase family protein [Methyloligella sp. 2.7D]|uniref:linear amide C-N hydrolase n=1 Tax=unclassified Methyloligella TaxID=2625955 RepID=UPI00157BC380|nr:choloylglycine hydrolase family protein [Methyloligella sp. GL2]QKP76300.1 choloylglycine hydrolase family protein [Methyloligella sp. GL2]
MRTSLRNLICLTAAGCLAFAPAANACTSFLIKTKNGDPVYGRTMEFGMPLNSNIAVVPRGITFEANTLPGKKSWSWTGKYAATGMNFLGTPNLVDGVNEKGLAGGMLYFPGYAGYVDPAKADLDKAMGPWQFLTWALTNFATVDEVKTALGEIQIGNFAPPFNFGGQKSIPLHYTLHDATGNSIVIEPIDGELKVYDNPLGVLTNAPTFDWHLTNLKNYVKLSPYPAEPLKIDGESITSFGQGSGMLGVPGDSTPPSRFIRVLGYSISAAVQPDTDKAINTAEHILNNFDLMEGYSRPGTAAPDDITQWSGIADLKGKRYLFKTYEDQTLRQVDLNDFDLDGKKLIEIPIAQTNEIPKVKAPKGKDSASLQQ